MHDVGVSCSNGTLPQNCLAMYCNSENIGKLMWPIVISFRRASCDVCYTFYLNNWTYFIFNFLKLSCPILFKLSMIHFRVRETKIINFMTLVPYGPLGQDKTGQSLTIFKYLLIFFLTSLRKNIFIFIYTWKPSTKIVNFMFSGEGSFVLTRDQNGHTPVVTMHIMLKSIILHFHTSVRLTEFIIM